jgi:transcriptional regulator with XRE-family HTH domain
VTGLPNVNSSVHPLLWWNWKEAHVPEHSDQAVGGHPLGDRLRRARQKRSLTEVAATAGISSAYLQKLETGGVRQPSPNVLHQLADALDINYADLMRLAGYVVPGDRPSGRNELRYALSSEELTDEEAQELAEYLDWYRTRHSK